MKINNYTYIAFTTFCIFAFLVNTDAAILKKIQKGSTVIAAGSNMQQVTINKVIKNKSFLIFSVRTASADPGHFQIGGELVDSVTVAFHRFQGAAANNNVFIEWQVFEFLNGVTVQHGSRVNIAGVTDVVITPVTTLAKSFAIATAVIDGNNYNNDDGATAELISTNTLRLNGGATNATAYWQVVQYDSCDVQKISATLNNGELKDSAFINPVNKSKSLVLGNHRQDGTLNTDDLPRTELKNDSVVLFTRTGTSSNVDFILYVVEFTDLTTVSHYSASFLAAENTKAVTITSVDTNLSGIIAPGNFGRQGSSTYTADDSVGYVWFTFDMVSSTSVDIKRASQGSTAQAPFQVVSFLDCSIISANAGSDDATCTNTYNLMANDPSPGIGVWSLGVPGSGTFLDSTDQNTTVSGLSSGPNRYMWKVTLGACSVTDEVIITKNTVVTANAGVNDTTCILDYTLSGNNPAPDNGKWLIISGAGIFNDSSIFNTTVSGLSLGMNSIKWTISNANCTSSDTVVIYKMESPASNAGTDDSICGLATTYNLTANNFLPGMGTWTLLSGSGMFADSSDSTTMVNNLSLGINQFVWTIDLFDCSSSDTVAVKLDTIIPAMAGLTDTICDSAYVLQANNPIGGFREWNIINGFGFIESPNDFNSILSMFFDGDILLQWTINNGACQSLDTLALYVNKLNASDAGLDDTTFNTIYTLAGNDPDNDSGQWIALTSGSTIVEPSNGNSLVTNLIPGENKFIWQLWNENCYSNDTVNIYRDTVIIVNAGIDDTICLGDTIMLGGLSVVQGGVPPFTYYWTPNISLNSDSLANPDAFPTEQITYVVMVTDSIGLYGYDSIIIAVNKLPEVSAGDNIKIQKETNSQLMASGASTYIWTPSDYLSCTICQNPIATPTTSIVYYVTGTDSNNCSASDSVTVTVIEIIVYDGVSLNNDGKNDYLRIDGLELFKENELTIFNDWGNDIIKLKNYDNQNIVWDGKDSKGNTVASGTYFYNLKLVDQSNAEEILTGFIHVNKQ